MKPLKQYDIIIAGGGPSGVAAAIAAARRNPAAKVLLIEHTTSLGGMSTVGMVSRMTRFTDEEKVIYNGIAAEIMTRYKQAAGIDVDFWNKTPLFTEILKIVLDDMVAAEHIEVLFDATVVDTTLEGNHITALTVAQKEGLVQYGAAVYVDCTGDGDVAYHSGVPFEKGGEGGTLQPCSLAFSISGVHYGELAQELLHVPYGKEMLEKGDTPLLVPARDGLPNIRVLNSGRHTFWYEAAADKRWPLVCNHFVPVLEGDGTIYANAGHLYEVDTTDAASLSRAYTLGRKTAAQYLEALKTYFPKTFAEASIAVTAPLMGVREGRRFEAQYRLTVDDYFDRATFDDEICRNHNWLDCHRSKGEKEGPSGKLEPGETHGIPFRCLVPKQIDNLLLAGRCICVDRAVFASVRVMPNCFMTGEAAGIAAAMAFKDGLTVQQIDGVAVSRSMHR